MGRPSKSLEEHVRGRTFRADRHAQLLAGSLVTDKRLRALQATYQAASSDRERRSLALEFADEVGRQENTKLATVEDLDVPEFFERYFRHTKGPKAGEPFILEPFQREFVQEFYRRDEEDRRIYRLGLLGLPRGNGKSPLAAGLALYELLSRHDAPDVFVAAGGRDQARIAFDFARRFVEGGDLAELVRVGRNEIVYPDRLGSMRVLSAEGALQHGLSVSCAIVDELWAFTTEKQQELFTALETALHKRLESFLLAITTAGSDRLSLLGRLYDRGLAQLELEQPSDFLTIGRDEENGVLYWWHGAPDEASADDEETWRACNPASWVDLRDLRRQRNSPSTSEATFRRLHLNQWTAGEDVWITPERWAACRSGNEIPEGAEVFVGVDAAYTGDATAVAWAHRDEEGSVLLRAHVWSAVAETPAHVHVAGGHTDFESVEDFISTLAQRYQVREVVFDPAFFARSAEILSARGLILASLAQHSEAMRQAYSQFYEAVNSRTLAHEGDEVLTAHVLNAAAHVNAAGHWKIRKVKQSHKIDGLVASVIAHSRAAREPAGLEPFMAFV